MIKYDKLWMLMKDKNITKYQLHTKYNISKSLLHRLKYNEPVSTNTLDRLCNILGCGLSDIAEHIPDENTFN